jgi:hypothetical protein
MKPAIVVLASTLGFATAAYAGLRNTVTVTVDTVNHKAFGSLGEARNSPDNLTAGGCQTAIVSGGQMSVLCFAVNSSGVQVMCNSTDVRFVLVAQSLGPDGAFAFSYDPNTGNCLTLLVFNASEFGPKLP